jgi:hypothetical protein
MGRLLIATIIPLEIGRKDIWAVSFRYEYLLSVKFITAYYSGIQGIWREDVGQGICNV